MSEETRSPRFRFGPLERGTVVLGLRPGQLVVLGLAVLPALVCLNLVGGFTGAMLAFALSITAVCAAFFPIGTRTLEQWTPFCVRYLVSGWRGRHRHRNRAHLQGHTQVLAPQVESLTMPEFAPPMLSSLQVLHAEVEGSAPLGVVKDARAKTWTAALALGGRNFDLLASYEQDRIPQQWAALLSTYGRHSSPVSRLQWIERTVPDDVGAVKKHFEAHGDPGAPAAMRESYAVLAGQAGPTTQLHECLMAIQVSVERGGKLMRQLGQGDLDRGAAAILARELESLSSRLTGLKLQVHGVLNEREIGRVIQFAADPSRRRIGSILDAAREAQGAAKGVHPQICWPRFAHERPNALHTDSAYHRTMHVLEWPRFHVGPGFLSPLILGTRTMRTVSMTMEAVSPFDAIRAVERKHVAHLSDETARRKVGQVTTARHRRAIEDVEQTEQELADGHVSVRFSAYVTVTTQPRDDVLEAAAAEVQEQAALSGLQLEDLMFEQGEAWTYTLPLCRGLEARRRLW